ncbi:protein-glutamine gamma-glutamyltransferase 2-like [Narcine bancroftii]|uniref:protein-glutamine gamma-glutamyltransferase 2-like n=1 Tax=Narcine bancroftii TaxID=1343680 RepID=UPI0038310813
MAEFAELRYSTDFQCERNNKEHRTDVITTKQLIVRRGQAFHITLQVDRNDYITDQANMIFSVETGPKPSESSGTKVLFELWTINPMQWSGRLVSTTGTTLDLTIFPSPSARIGRHTLNLLRCRGSQVMKVKLGEFILLFNPWCREDEVFLDNEEQRQEYVMNEDGIIFNGSCHQIESRHWYFGQFEEKVVDICLQVLDQSNKCKKNPSKDYERRNDPVYISRVVTAMVNCADDKGILAGRWNEPYDGGVLPWAWNGSVPILHRWHKGGCQPVRYGQCWVFAAVACTVLRCLGIPARVVTNFNSAHDTNSNLIIDQVIGECGIESGDSVWNFHVWIEGWMERNDLKFGYNGWQVLDPTPQEKSEGIYCCGPAPLHAIKGGALDMRYDVPFVFAEVNADVVTWICYKDGKKVKKCVETQHVGKLISTKSCGRNDREDITNKYKFPEGSQKEREVYNEAKFRNNLEPIQEDKLIVKIKADESINYGSDIHALAQLTNNSSETMNCRLIINAQILKYTGQPVDPTVPMSMNEVVIKGHEVKSVSLKVPFSDISKYLKNHQMIKLTALSVDTRTNENSLAMKDICVIKPSIAIKILGSAIVNHEMSAEINFRNPLSEPLFNCVLSVEGIELIDGIEQMRIKEIKANQEVQIMVKFIPKKPGLRKLMVDFDCHRITDVKGFQNISVKYI